MHETKIEVPQNKNQLLQQIRQTRELLLEKVNSLSEEEMEAPGPQRNWSIKDHLAHLVSWTEKVLAVLRSQPGYEGLKVEERTHLEIGLEDFNAALHERNLNRPVRDVLVDLSQSHLELLSVLEQLDEATLSGPYDALEPAEQRTLLEGAAAHTYAHDLEHLAWIEELVSRPLSSA